MPRVFISSTSKDLAGHRAAVRDAVLKLGMHPIMMEHFPAMDANALDACQRKVLDCDLFVGIYAHRYGYIPADQGKSITELEYDWAVAADLPRRVFVIKPGYEWPHELSDMGDDYTKLDAFKKRVGAERVWSEFTTPDSLAAAVTQSLVHDAERLSREQATQRRLFLTIGSIITLLLVGIIAAIVVFANPDEIKQADRDATNQAVAYANQTNTATQWTATPTPTSTSTSTLTPTPTFTPTPTATPLEGSVAKAGEVLLVITDFEYASESLRETLPIEANLENPLENEGINFVRVHYELDGTLEENRAQAREISEVYQATLLVWGEVTATAVYVYFDASPEGMTLSEDLEFPNMIMREGTGVQYLFYLIQGYLLYFERQYAEALRIFENAESFLDPEWESAAKAEGLYFYMGRCYQYQAKHQAAIDYYTRAIALDATDASIFYNRGVAYADLGDYAAAIADYDQAIALDPIYANAFNNRGAAQYKLGDYDKAIADYNQAIALNLTFAEAFYNRGLAYKALGNYNQAIADLDQAIALNPTYTDAFYNRGSAYYDLGDYDKAIADFTQVIALDPADASAFYNRGLMYLHRAGSDSDFEVARDDFTRVIDLPENVNTYALRGYPNGLHGYAYGLRGYAYYRLGEYDLALPDLREYRDRVGDEAEPTILALLTELEAPLITPTPFPNVTNALFPDGTTITLPGPRPVSLLTEPLSGLPSIFCTPSTEATALQTVQLANGTRWVQLECDGGIGWMDESKLPTP